MQFSRRLKILGLSASLAFVGPLAAQDSNPYQHFVDALASRERLMEGFAQTAEQTMTDEAARDPDMVKIEEECPGTLKAMAVASMPIMVRSHGRAVDEYRAGLLALFSDRLTEQQAASAAEFYSSEDGVFLITLAEESEVSENSLADVRANEDGSISREAFDADKAAQRAALRQGEHQERIAAIGMKLVASDWFVTFAGLRDRVHALEYAMNNDDFSPEEDAALDHVIEKAMLEHFDRCYAE